MAIINGKKPLRMSDMTVESIMTSNVFTLTPAMSLRDAIMVLLRNKISGAPVLDSNSRVISVVSEGNMLKIAAFEGLDATIQSCLDQLVKPSKIISVRKTDSVLDAYKLFLTNPVKRLIVMDTTGKLQGVVSRSNILKVFLQIGAAS